MADSLLAFCVKAVTSLGRFAARIRITKHERWRTALFWGLRARKFFLHDDGTGDRGKEVITARFAQT